MADNVEVSCISKRQHHNPHERIRGFGGIHNGKRWWLSENDAIYGIEAGKWAFYTNVGGRSVWVIVAVYDGRKYLKTQADGYEPNNLLSLPECPQ